MRHGSLYQIFNLCRADAEYRCCQFSAKRIGPNRIQCRKAVSHSDHGANRCAVAIRIEARFHRRTDRCPKGRSVRIFASAYFGSGGGVGYAGAAAYGVTSTRKREKSSEEAAFEDLESYGATVYMGAPVIQADLGGKGGGLSYGIIILDDDYEYNEDGMLAIENTYDEDGTLIITKTYSYVKKK